MANDAFWETCYINQTPVETNGEIWKNRGALGNLGCNINKWKQFFPVALVTSNKRHTEILLQKTRGHRSLVL